VQDDGTGRLGLDGGDPEIILKQVQHMVQDDMGCQFRVASHFRHCWARPGVSWGQIRLTSNLFGGYLGTILYMHQSRLILTEPTFADEAAVLAFRERFTGHNSAGEIPGGAGLQTAESYSEWLSTVRQYGSAKTVPLGRVQASTYLAKPQENGKVIGIIQIRHALTPHLLQVGGHIGYSVSPDERRRGYGTQMLQLAP
jgi:predicted acetyltransferase